MEITIDTLKKFEKQFASFTRENNSLKIVLTKIERENTSLKIVNASLTRENTLLTSENTSLKRELTKSVRENTSLKTENASLKTETTLVKQKYEKLIKICNNNTIYHLKLPIQNDNDFICKVINLPVKDAYGGSTPLKCIGITPISPIGSCSKIYPVGELVNKPLSIDDVLLVSKSEGPNSFYIKFIFTKTQLTQLNSININITDLYN